MSSNGLAFLRYCAQVSQARMAEAMGVPLRTYEDIEAGRSKYREIHKIAGQAALLTIALEKQDASVLTSDLRDRVLKVADLINKKPA